MRVKYTILLIPINCFGFVTLFEIHFSPVMKLQATAADSYFQHNNFATSLIPLH